MKRVLDEEVIDTFDITGLPRDVKIFIAQKLSVPDFMNLAQTNKLFMQASENGETWKMFLLRDMPKDYNAVARHVVPVVTLSENHPAYRKGMRLDGNAWKRYYLHMRHLYYKVSRMPEFPNIDRTSFDTIYHSIWENYAGFHTKAMFRALTFEIINNLDDELTFSELVGDNPDVDLVYTLFHSDLANKHPLYVITEGAKSLEFGTMLSTETKKYWIQLKKWLYVRRYEDREIIDILDLFLPKDKHRTFLNNLVSYVIILERPTILSFVYLAYRDRQKPQILMDMGFRDIGFLNFFGYRLILSEIQKLKPQDIRVRVKDGGIIILNAGNLPDVWGITVSNMNACFNYFRSLPRSEEDDRILIVRSCIYCAQEAHYNEQNNEYMRFCGSSCQEQWHLLMSKLE